MRRTEQEKGMRLMKFEDVDERGSHGEPSQVEAEGLHDRRLDQPAPCGEAFKAVSQDVPRPRLARRMVL
jgi:hypothetical protein